MRDKHEEEFAPYYSIYSEAKFTGILFLILFIVFEGAIAYADYVNHGSNANYPVCYIVVLFAIILIIIFEAFPMSVIRFVLIQIDRFAGNVTLRDVTAATVRNGIVPRIVSFNKSRSPAYQSFKLKHSHSLLHMTFTDSKSIPHHLWIDSSFMYTLDGHEAESLVFSWLVYGRLSKVVLSFQIHGTSDADSL